MHSSCPSRPGRRFGAWGSKTAWAFGLLVALAGRLGAAAPRDELLRFVPADVGFCLVLQDLRGHAADLLASPFVRQLRQSPAGAALRLASREDWLKQAEEKHLREHLKIGWKELRDDILGDAVVFAYRPGPPARPEQEQGLILLYARNAKVLAGLVDRINEAQKSVSPGLQAGGGLKRLQRLQLEERWYNGVSYYRRVERDKSTYYHLCGPVLIFSGQEEMLRRAIDQDRAAPADAEPPVTRRFRELGLGRSLFVLWLNPRAFDSHVDAKVAQAQAGNVAALKTFAVYWKAVDSLGLALGLDRDVSLSLAVRARTEQMPAAARRFLAEASRPSMLWQSFPEHPLLALAGRVDAAALVEALAEFMTRESRQALQNNLNRPLSAFFGMDFLKEVLPAVGPDWGLHVTAPSAQDKGWFPHIVLAVRVNPGEEAAAVDRALLRTLTSWAGLGAAFLTRQFPGPPIKLRTTTGQDRGEIHYLSGEGVFPPGVEPAFALQNGYLVLTSSLEAMRRFGTAPPAAAPAPPSAPVPLLRVSFKELRRYLQERREALAGAVAGKDRPAKDQALVKLDRLVDALQLLDGLEVRQRSTAGQVTFTLTLQTAQPLK